MSQRYETGRWQDIRYRNIDKMIGFSCAGIRIFKNIVFSTALFK